MRRELGQLSLADGLVEWVAFEDLLGEVYAVPVGRPSTSRWS